MVTIPRTFSNLLIHQFDYIKGDCDIYLVSSRGAELEKLRTLGLETKAIQMIRGIAPFSDLISILRLTKYLRKVKPNIVHSHTPKAGLIAMISAWLSHVPVRMHTVAGLQFESAIGVNRIILIAVEKLVYRLATHVLPNSYASRDFIITNNLVDQKKVEVLGSGATVGIDLNEYRFTQRLLNTGMVIRRHHNILDNDKVFLFIGRIVKDKGIEELLTAFNLLSMELKEVHLIILGIYEGHLNPISNELSKILFNHEKVHYLGYIRDVRPLYCACDYFVFPSHREGLSNALMEACAMELPIVASDIAPNKEIIVSGDNGLIVPVKSSEALLSAFRKLLNNDNLAQEMGRKAREVIIDKYERNKVLSSLRTKYLSFKNDQY